MEDYAENWKNISDEGVEYLLSTFLFYFEKIMPTNYYKSSINVQLGRFTTDLIWRANQAKICMISNLRHNESPVSEAVSLGLCCICELQHTNKMVS